LVINDPGAELTGISPQKWNAMTIKAYTGDQIAAAASTAVDGEVCYCYSSGSVYLQGHWYGFDDTLGAWVDLNGFPDFYEYFNSNKQKGVVDKRFATKEMWHNSASGTGAAVNNTVTGGVSSIDLVTGTTTTGVAMLQIGGPLLDFSKQALLKLKIKTPAATTGQVVKLGVGMDKAGTGPATTRMFGVEYCDGDTDWQIHSATGSAQSNNDTVLAVSAATVWGIDIVYTPGSSIVVNFDDGTTKTPKTKSTDIPSSGNCAEDSLIKLSISNNNGSSTSRTLSILGCYLVYAISDPVWD